MMKMRRPVMKGPLAVPVTDSLPALEGIRWLLDEGWFEEARWLLDRLTPPLREAAAARFLRGLCCMKLGELPEAVSTLERLVTQVPDNGYAYHYLGLGADGRGDIRGATACFRRALELRP
jgi:tetratricopeptide (TPR) repeat protein